MRKSYEEPSINVTQMNTNDVITTSTFKPLSGTPERNDGTYSDSFIWS